jgi:sulfur carrier protein ThiS
MAEKCNDCVELRGFGNLNILFRERNWPFPMLFPLSNPLSGSDLLDLLDIRAEQVEVLLINGKVNTRDAEIKPGDRVALVPPGTPGPYRVLLGFVDRRQPLHD